MSEVQEDMAQEPADVAFFNLARLALGGDPSNLEVVYTRTGVVRAERTQQG